jgi:hypothetical protein
MLAVRRTVGATASSDDFSDAEDRQTVRHVLATLPPRQRAALVLTEMLGVHVEGGAVPRRGGPVLVREQEERGSDPSRSDRTEDHD